MPVSSKVQIWKAHRDAIGFRFQKSLRLTVDNPYRDKVINWCAFRNVLTVFIPLLTLLRKDSRLQFVDRRRPCFLRNVTKTLSKLLIPFVISI